MLASLENIMWNCHISKKVMTIWSRVIVTFLQKKNNQILPTLIEWLKIDISMFFNEKSQEFPPALCHCFVRCTKKMFRQSQQEAKREYSFCKMQKSLLHFHGKKCHDFMFKVFICKMLKSQTNKKKIIIMIYFFYYFHLLPALFKEKSTYFNQYFAISKTFSTF